MDERLMKPNGVPTRVEHAIRHLRVVHPYRFLEHESGAIAKDLFPPDDVRKAFRGVKLPDSSALNEKSKAQSVETYINGINDALQLCCPTRQPMGPHIPGSYFPTSPLRCVDVRQSLNGQLHRQPDLLIGFDTEFIEPMASLEQYQIHNSHGIPVFVHRAPQMDIGCSSKDSLDEIEKTLQTRKSVTVALREMLEYMFAYPWRLYPHRFSYCIIIAGPWLRLWKWEIGGCEVSDAISFRNDPIVIYRFLQLIGELPYYGLGVDVGTDGIFQTIPLTPLNNKKMRHIIALYHSARTNREEANHWKAKALARCTLWKFKKWDVSDLDPEVREKRNQVDLVVLSHPIHSDARTYCHHTRCYLAIPEPEFRLFYEGARTLADINVLKTSWTPMNERPELKFYQLIKKRGVDVPNIPTVLAGGYTAPIRNYLKLIVDLDEGRNADEDNVRRRAEMKMNWLLMKEVGALAHTDILKPREMLENSALLLEAIRQLGEANIVHRNISPTNVLVNLVTRDCLLVDLSLALDGEHETETMSISLASFQEVMDKFNKRLSPTSVTMNRTEMGLVLE